jgi:hypothetical protein
MTLTLASFIVSLAGIAGMFAVKIRELRSGTPSFLTRLSEETNHVVHDLYGRVRTFVSHFNRKNALLAIGFAAHGVIVAAKRAVHWVEEKVNSHPYKLLDVVRGKGHQQVKHDGPAPTHLPSRSEGEEKGRIE